MKLQNGVDIISLARFARALERSGQPFLQRIFTPSEIALCAGRTESLAARFAAKEAVAKALGCGIGPISWQEIEILRAPNGAPRLQLHGAAREKALELGLANATLSLSHDGGVAIAFVTFYSAT